jgi:hypothetical protein
MDTPKLPKMFKHFLNEAFPTWSDLSIFLWWALLKRHTPSAPWEKEPWQRKDVLIVHSPFSPGTGAVLIPDRSQSGPARLLPCALLISAIKRGIHHLELPVCRTAAKANHELATSSVESVGAT